MQVSTLFCIQCWALDLRCLWKKGRRMEKGTECIWAWVSACNRSLCLGFFTLCCGPCSPAGQIIGSYLATYLEKRDRLLESLLWIILQTANWVAGCVWKSLVKFKQCHDHTFFCFRNQSEGRWVAFCSIFYSGISTGAYGRLSKENRAQLWTFPSCITVPFFQMELEFDALSKNESYEKNEGITSKHFLSDLYFEITKWIRKVTFSYSFQEIKTKLYHLSGWVCNIG